MKTTLTIAMLLVVALAGATRNRTTAQSRPDARAILERAAEACSRVQAIEYDEVHTTHAEGAPRLHAHVRQQRATVARVGFLPGRFRVDGSIDADGTSRPFAFSYDGQVLRILDVKRKRVQVSRSADAGDAGRLLGEPGIVGIPQFSDDQPFRSVLLQASTIAHEGTRTIEGVDCDAIAVEQKFDVPSLGERTVRTVWFIGIADRLPRGNAVAGTEKHVRIINVNGAAPADQFDIPRPADYVEVAITGKEADAGGLLPLGSVAPDWTLIDAEGHPHSLADLRGRVVLLDFWGTWCVPCLKTMPTIQALHERFGQRGLAVFGIAVADNEGDPRGYMKRQGFTYTLLLDGDAVAKAYKAVVLPTLYIVGPDGRILHAEHGFRDGAKDELTRMLERWLAAAPPR